MTIETDKKLADLYLARSRGKIIEARDALCNWHTKNTFEAIHIDDRIRPETVGEAAVNYRVDQMLAKNSFVESSFIAGAKWQKKQQD